MRSKEEILSEFNFYMESNLPPASLASWIQSLPDEEMQIVFDEIETQVARISQWFETVLKPAFVTAMATIQGFVESLSPEFLDALADPSRDVRELPHPGCGPGCNEYGG